METKKKEPPKKKRKVAKPRGRPPKNKLKATNSATPKQREFVECYVDKGAATYLNATRSYAKAYEKDYDYANSHGYSVLRSKAVRESIQERLGREKIDDLMESGLTKLLSNPKSNPGAFVRAVELVAKMRGLFAPEKHLNVNLTQEQREQAYEDLLKRIEEKQRGGTVSYVEDAGQKA